MNPLTKLVILLTAAGSIVVGSFPTEAVRSPSSALTQVRSISARVATQVAAEVRATVVTSLSVVRLPARTRTFVFVEGNHMIIEARRHDVLKITDVIAELRASALRL